MGKQEEQKEHKRNKKGKKHARPSTRLAQTTSVKAAAEVPEVQNEEIIYESDLMDVIDVVDHEQEVSDTQTTQMPSSSIITPPKPSSTKNVGSSSKKSSTKQTPPPLPTIPAPAPASNNSSPIASTSAGASANTSSNKKSKTKRRDSSTSSEEERWLTAIEAGKLEEMDDELKKMKDPKLMTARQRAMYERGTDKEPSPGGEILMALPSGYREKEKPQTAEDIQKAQLKSQKRKQLADEKREKDKKKTMERLLKKQESKQRNAARNKGAKTAQPMISYRNTLDGAYIILPPEHEFPLEAQVAKPPPKVQSCGIAGCGNPKVYNCSKTNLPLCSFACYRKNVQNIRQIMC